MTRLQRAAKDQKYRGDLIFSKAREGSGARYPDLAWFETRMGFGPDVNINSPDLDLIIGQGGRISGENVEAFMEWLEYLHEEVEDGTK